MHLDRVIKLLDKVTALDGKNDLIKKKLNAKRLDGQRETESQSGAG